VGDAAKIMTEQSVSCVLVMSSAGLQAAEIQGVVTDRDLRTRVVAAGRNADETAARYIMTAEPVTIGADDSVFEAMLVMLRRNIHHLPVVHHGHPIRRVLIVTFTQTNQQELIHRLRTQVGDRYNLEVLGWYTFLLRHFVKPFLPFKFPGERVGGFNFEGRPSMYAKNKQRFMDSSNQIYACELGRLAR
ncbi:MULTISPECIES: CBS domain-containing protein, partial [unclassified Pseudomonas]|uniref:CBS domain-containing protein n=1 Tax=unclassified Pseudomonas TaxID=196821 RepID=UPI002113921E